MSFFGVTIEQIETIAPIVGADSIDRATLVGKTYEFVVPKGKFLVGETVVYFPVDSVLPLIIQEKLGLVGRLAGSNKDRIKVIKLRGQYSCGVVAKMDIIADLLQSIPNPSTEEITAFLGVSKYEPPTVPCKTGNLCALPVGLNKYDIESVNSDKGLFDSLLDERVVISEKLEGSNASISYDPVTDTKYVNSRNYTIIPIDGKTHDWWGYVDELNIWKCLKDLSNQYNAPVTFYGEWIGPNSQGNIYKLPKNKVCFFDIKVGGNFLDYHEQKNIFTWLGLETVPILSDDKTLREWLGDKSVVDASHGISKLANTYREGIVIKPVTERYADRFGRVIFKFRDLIYLEKTGM